MSALQVAQFLSLVWVLTLRLHLTRAGSEPEFDFSSLEVDPNCGAEWTVLSPTHTMCLTNQPGQILDIPQEAKDAALNAHNKYRGTVGTSDAGNKVPTIMAKVTWDENLAKFASRWAAVCHWGHDPSSMHAMGSSTPFTAGQNAAKFSSHQTNATGLMMSSANMWYAEVRDFTLGGPNDWTKVGHFTQVTAAKVSRIGCGIAQCTTESGNKFTQAFCNYGYSYQNSQNPYKAGETRGDGCPDSYKQSEGLCDCGGKLCYSNGEIDLNSCTCACAYDKPWFNKDDCSVNCESGVLEDQYPDWCKTEKVAKSDFCRDIKNAYSYCPMTCNVCQKCNGKICLNGGKLNLATCKCECSNDLCSPQPRFILDPSSDVCKCKDTCPDKCDPKYYLTTKDCECDCYYNPTLYKKASCQETVDFVKSNCKTCGLASAKGTGYCGTLATTKNGYTCQSWTATSPHFSMYTKPKQFGNIVTDMSEVANYCRNPDASGDSPWCYTTDKNKKWEYCNIPVCNACPEANCNPNYYATTEDCQCKCLYDVSKFGKDTCEATVDLVKANCKTCLLTDKGLEYCGTLSTTASGYTCQSWAVTTPHWNSYTKPEQFGVQKISDVANYCRNPDASGDRPWCYTTDENKSWEYCDISKCN